MTYAEDRLRRRARRPFSPCGVERMVEKMRKRGLSAEDLLLPDKTHGGISPEDREQMNQFILNHCSIS